MCSNRGRGHRHTEAGGGKKRNANTTITGEIVSISAPKWDKEGELKSKLPAFLFNKPFLLSFPVLLFRI